MARLVLLGSAAAVPNATHENTYMVLQASSGAVLIDCAGSPIGRLEQAGIPYAELNTIIMTHIHPDHAYGFPLLLMGLWLLGRTDRLHVHALGVVVDRLRMLMDAYDLHDWPRFYPVDFHPVEEAPATLVLDNGDFRITTARNQHMVPTLSVRIENKATRFVTTYSSDTAPCEELLELARGSDLLIHEAAGATPGHSSAAQAGEMAARAGAKKLVLVHYQVHSDPEALVAEAGIAFNGPIEVAQDMAEYTI